ncbi:MAG TPA: phosphomethylpyrimidine synthase ThiC, partial [Thermogutta sp.]|nr:phosphomethylpyrimidine synthase ThiC [Thermogutta sp.]
LSRARYRFDWNEQFRLAIDPERARQMWEETARPGTSPNAKYCSMCGPKFCSMRLSQDVAQSQQSANDPQPSHVPGDA